MSNSAKVQCLLILGMHRSGTSALAGSIQKLGLRLGSELLEPSFDNADGFFEHKCVVSLNDRLLSVLGGSWSNPPSLSGNWWQQPNLAAFRREAQAIIGLDFPDDPLFALKDPRLCLLQPFWIDVLKSLRIDPVAIHMIRSPEEVADSLFRRDRLATELAYDLWERYVTNAERDGVAIIRSRCSFDDLLQSPVKTLERCGDELGIQWPLAAANIQESLTQFLAPAKRHQVRHPRPDLPERLTSLYRSVVNGQPALPPAETNGARTVATAHLVEEKIFPQAARLAALDAAGIALSTYVGNLATREMELEEAARSYHRQLTESRIESESLEAAGVQRLCAAIYWDDGVLGYAEDRSVRQHVQIGTTDDPTTLEFRLGTADVAALRFDPLTRPGAIILTQVRLLTAEGKVLWAWSGTRDGIMRRNQVVLLDNSNGPGLTILATGYDPYLEFSMPEMASTDYELIVQVEINSSSTQVQSAVSGLGALSPAPPTAQPETIVLRSCTADINQKLAELSAETRNAMASLAADTRSLSVLCKEMRQVGQQTEQATLQLLDQQSAWLKIAAAREADLAEARRRISTLENWNAESSVNIERIERELSSANERFAERDASLLKARATVAAREEEVAELRSRLAEVEDNLLQIQDSVWWKTTGPLRAIANRLRRIAE